MTTGRVRGLVPPVFCTVVAALRGVRQRLGPRLGAGTWARGLCEGGGRIRQDHRRVPAPRAGQLNGSTSSRRRSASRPRSPIPLHPTSEVTQVIMGGQVDEKPFRTEVTLLPGTKPIPFKGATVDTAIIQYVAYLGRTHPRGGPRLVRPGRRRLGVVLRRGRIQLRGRQGRRHQGDVDRQRQRRRPR